MRSCLDLSESARARWWLLSRAFDVGTDLIDNDVLVGNAAEGRHPVA
jgi:hypothetical protein